jgi:hypothetical protein
MADSWHWSQTCRLRRPETMKILVGAAVARCGRTAGPPELPVPAIFMGVWSLESEAEASTTCAARFLND